MGADGRTSVLLVEHNPNVVRSFHKLFAMIDRLAVCEDAKTAADALGMMRITRPDMVLVEQSLPDVDGIKFTEMIRQEFPEVQVVIISQDKQYDIVLNAMRNGAFDFLTYDVSLDELTEVVKRGGELAESERRRLQPFAYEPTQPVVISRAAQGNIISVYSPKGGAGTTTLAINLSLALRSADYNVALVDGSLQFGDVALMFNEIGRLSLLDLAPRVKDLDNRLVEDVMLYHKTSGMYILPAPSHAGLTDTISGEQFCRIVEYMRDMYRYVVINTHPFLNETSLAAMDSGDITVLVVTQEIAAIRSARSFLEMWDSIGFDRNRLVLVVNRFDKNSPITVKKMSDTLKNPIAMTIPADPAAYKAANLGVPLLLNDSKSPMSRAIIDLAAMVTRQASQVPVDDRFHVFLQY